MAICWERAVLLAFYLYCFNFSAILVVRASIPFSVWDRMWNSIVSVPDHCLFIYFICGVCACYLKHALFSKRPWLKHIILASIFRTYFMQHLSLGFRESLAN